MHPCISNTRSPVWFTVGEKKNNNNNATQPIRAACSARRAPDSGGDVWDAVKAGFVHRWLAFPAFLPAFFFFFFLQVNETPRRYADEDGQTQMHRDECSAMGKSCCWICSTQLSKAEARQAIRGSSCWALDCIPLTFIQWFMSEDLSPSQWDPHTQLFKTHNGEKGWRGEKKLKILLWGFWTYITPNYQNFSQPLWAPLLFVRLTKYLQCHWRVYKARVPTWLVKTLLLFLPRWVLLHNGGLEGCGLRAGLPNKALVACSRQERVLASMLPKN